LVAEDLASVAGGKLKLILQPYVRLLSFRYPVDDLLLEVRKEDEDTDFASNTFTERRKRKRARAVAKRKPAQIFLAVHRIDNSVYFRRLEQEDFSILTALQQGKNIGAAVESAMRKSALPPEEWPAKVQTCFQTWAALGWFCRPEKKRAGR
jgi:hypothetical protein